MSNVGVAPCAAPSVSNARAEASRRNGARSRGPRSAEGKARAAQNALKHGLRAEHYVVLLDEDWDEFAALEAALTDELAPQSALQHILARRVARAAWRLMRADRLEVELFGEHSMPSGGLGRALIRDGHRTRAFETPLRYRGAAQAELGRALAMLKALQAEQAAALPARASEPSPLLTAAPQARNPNEPETRGYPAAPGASQSGSAADVGPPALPAQLSMSTP